MVLAGRRVCEQRAQGGPHKGRSLLGFCRVGSDASSKGTQGPCLWLIVKDAACTPPNKAGLWAKGSPVWPSHQTTSCLCWVFYQCGPHCALLHHQVPNGIPGSGMCNSQSAPHKCTQGAYMKQGEPGSHTSWAGNPEQLCPARPRVQRPSWQQAYSMVSTAAPSPAGAPLRPSSRSGAGHGQ